MKRIAATFVMATFLTGLTGATPLVEPRPNGAVKIERPEKKKAVKATKVKKQRGFKSLMGKSLGFVAESALFGGMSDH